MLSTSSLCSTLQEIALAIAVNVPRPPTPMKRAENVIPKTHRKLGTSKYPGNSLPSNKSVKIKANTNPRINEPSLQLLFYLHYFQNLTFLTPDF
ncbi:MAG: hypothetical protein ACYTFY_12455 [Planctomycetota bacterium]|jgi:hypothetical protein